MDVTEDLKAVLNPWTKGTRSFDALGRRSTKRWPISSSLPRSELCSATRFESLRSYREKLDAGTIEIAAFGMVSRGNRRY